MKNQTFRMTMLFDFYGELLTERQKEFYELYYDEDLSLSEIAEQCGISRQGVWDNIRRAEAAMRGIEEKTGLIRRFLELEKGLDRLSESVRELAEITDGRAGELARAALHEIETLRG